MEDLSKEKLEMLEAFQQSETTYHIDVLDNSMLPEKLKERKKIDFIVNPPVITTLARAAQVMETIPQTVLSEEEIDFNKAYKYAKEMVQVFCIISWAKNTDYPEWYEPFIMQNVTPRELYLMFQEVVLKSQIGFFLNSFHLNKIGNPMSQAGNPSTPMRS